MPGAGSRLRSRSGKKPKEDESDIDSESIGVVGTFETLRDEGGHFMHVGQFKKAIESFTKALEMNEGDKHCLVLRSRCHLQLGEAGLALKDAEMSLTQEKDFIPALYRKAEALYQQGDFETALVYYHRGNKLRPELPDFLLGISKAQEAINNSIGSPSTVKLKVKGDLSIFEKHQEKKNQRPQKEGYKKPSQRVVEKKVRQRPVTSGNTKMMKQLLEELYVDKEYLEQLLADSSLTGSESNTSAEIRNLILDELDYIDTRVNFWKCQKPLYARKKKPITNRSENHECQAILNDLEEIDNELLRGNFRKALEKAKKTLKTAENSSEAKVPEKFLFIANLHSCLGNAFMELEDFDSAELHHNKDFTISEEHKQDTGRAIDNLGRTYARMGKYKKAINIWEGKLNSKLMAIEKTWLYHEIGRCHLELEEYEQSYDYGRMSLSAAEEIKEEDWRMNASLLCAQSLVNQNQGNAALPYYQQVMDIAKEQGRTDVEERMKKIIEDLEVTGSEKEDTSLDLSPRQEDSNSVNGNEMDAEPKTLEEEKPSSNIEKEDADDTAASN